MSGRMKVLVWHEPHQALFQFIKVLRHKVMQLIPERADAEFQTNDASLKFNVKVQRVASTLPLQAKVGVRLCALTSRFRPPPSRGCAVRQPPPWMRTVAAPPDCGNRADSWDIANFMHIYFKKRMCYFACARSALCWSQSPALVSCRNRCSAQVFGTRGCPWSSPVGALLFRTCWAFCCQQGELFVLYAGWINKLNLTGGEKTGSSSQPREQLVLCILFRHWKKWKSYDK